MTGPLLLEFAEPVGTDLGSVGARLGTETFTKTIGEGGDADADQQEHASTLAPPRLGTATHTAGSEEQDADRDPTPELAMGTETVTEVRSEANDADEPRRGGGLWEVALL
jgi:hypothetical protein